MAKSKKRRRRRPPGPPGVRKTISLAAGYSPGDKNLVFRFYVSPGTFIVMDKLPIIIRYRWRVPNPTYSPTAEAAADKIPYIYVTNDSITKSSDETAATASKTDIEGVFLPPTLGEAAFFEDCITSVNQYPVQLGVESRFWPHYTYQNRVFMTRERYKDVYDEKPVHFFTKNSLTTEKTTLTELQSHQFNCYEKTSTAAIPKQRAFTIDGKFPFNHRANIVESLMGSRLPPKFKQRASFLPGTQLEIRLVRRSNVAEEIMQRTALLDYSTWRTKVAASKHYRALDLEILDIKLSVTSYPYTRHEKIPKTLGQLWAFEPHMNRHILPANTTFTQSSILVPKHTQVVLVSFIANGALFFDAAMNKPLCTNLCFPPGLASLRFNLGIHQGLFVNDFINIGLPKKSYQADTTLIYYNWLVENHMAPFSFADFAHPKHAESEQSFVNALILDLRNYALEQDSHLEIFASFQAQTLSPTNTSIVTTAWTPVHLKISPTTTNDPVQINPL